MLKQIKGSFPKVDFQPEYYVQIPNWLFHDLAYKKIKPRDFVVYGAIQKFRTTPRKRPTTPTNGQLSALTGFSKSSIVAALDVLEKAGYINRYWIRTQSGEFRRGFKFTVCVENGKVIGKPSSELSLKEVDSIIPSMRAEEW